MKYLPFFHEFMHCILQNDLNNGFREHGNHIYGDYMFLDNQVDVGVGLNEAVVEYITQKRNKMKGKDLGVVAYPLQLEQIEEFKKLENKKLTTDIDYEQIKGLSLEARQKLNKQKPLSVGQASRISGVSPADISVLMIFLNQRGM